MDSWCGGGSVCAQLCWGLVCVKFMQWGISVWSVGVVGGKCVDI